MGEVLGKVNVKYKKQLMVKISFQISNNFMVVNFNVNNNDACTCICNKKNEKIK